MLFGAVVLAIFMVFVFAFGFLINRVKNAGFRKAWAPLIPIIQGKVVEDGGGAATSWLTGTYRGKRVRASMTPNRNRYSGESGHYYNDFDVSLLNVPGEQDWKIEYTTAILGFGHTGWRIVTKDKALEDRLNASGILLAISRFGSPEIAYQARSGVLQFSDDITPLKVPSPESFRDQLELLLVLAKVNEEVNTV
jgi:hypothetical protein